jgi:hypothetical protein
MAMAGSSVREDRVLAVDIAYFVGTMPVQRDRHAAERERVTGLTWLDRTVQESEGRSNDVGPDAER